MVDDGAELAVEVMKFTFVGVRRGIFERGGDLGLFGFELRNFFLERADFLDLVSDRVELLRGIFGVVTRDLRTVLDAAAAGRITTPGLTPVSVAKVIRHKTS